jgi:hypothetical protein
MIYAYCRYGHNNTRINSELQNVYNKQNIEGSEDGV